MDIDQLSKSTNLWPQLCEAYLEKYNVKFACRLHHYDHDMRLLAEKLEPMRSNSFEDFDLLIFGLFDSDYYYLDSKVGFAVHNLITLLYDLDISFAHCLIVTNHHGLSEHVKNLCRSFGSVFPIKVFENNFSVLQTNADIVKNPNNRSAKDIQYHFAFLSNVVRDHRIYLRCFIEHHKLNDKVLMSWHEKAVHPFEWQNTNTPNVSCSSTFVSVTPFTRGKYKIAPNTELAELYTKNQQCLTQTYKNQLIDSEANHNNFQASFLKYSFLNLVCETVFDFPYPYLTEKTFKCFWELSPFVIVGAAGSLAWLKNQGFKTFDNWIDESYDNLVDPRDRLLAIFKVVETVSNWSLNDCKTVYNQMTHVLQHNREHYAKYFCHELLNNSIKAIKHDTN